MAIRIRSRIVKKRKIGKKELKAKRRIINSRDKGARAERHVANVLTERGFIARRGMQFKGGTDSPDIICEELHKAFHFEVKFVNRFDLRAAVEQAKRDCLGLKMPVIVHKTNGVPWSVTMDLNEFIDLLQVVYGKIDTLNWGAKLILGEEYERKRYQEIDDASREAERELQAELDYSSGAELL